MYNAKEIILNKKTYKDPKTIPLKTIQWYELYRCGIPQKSIENNQQFYSDCRNSENIFGDMSVHKKDKLFSPMQEAFFKKHTVANYEGMSFQDAQYLIRFILLQEGHEHFKSIADDVNSAWAENRRGSRKNAHKRERNENRSQLVDKKLIQDKIEIDTDETIHKLQAMIEEEI